jgi:hydroxyethylthiazole kinase-like uncharacterized protein yjeF
MTTPPVSFSLSLFRIDDIRRVENIANTTLPPASLMRAAAKDAACFARELIGHPHGKVLILAGPGNNGGDALEVAHLLSTEGFEVQLILCANHTRYSDDARQSLQRAQASQVRFLSEPLITEEILEKCVLVVDGLFGIGLSKPINGEIATLIERLNQFTRQYRIPVLALDVPSGLNADTGQIVGDAGVAVRASHTISFIANKPGLHTAAGKDFSGVVTVADLALDPHLLPAPCGYLSHSANFSGLTKPRPHDSHKGSFGNVVVLGGATGMVGAPVLAGRAALNCGAGRVSIGFIAPAPPLDVQQPELMCRPADDYDLSQAVLVIGPGLGDSSAAEHLLSKALEQAPAMVIDADALNLIAARPNLQIQVAARSARKMSTILTPHPLEAARLLGISSQQIQADRWRHAQTLAKKFKACVVLKGAGTVITQADTPFAINTTGNPALATAGTGDVLAGICGALLAQHIAPYDAARLAVWLHGRAADSLVEQGLGPVGLTASELIPVIRTCLNDLIRHHQS